MCGRSQPGLASRFAMSSGSCFPRISLSTHFIASISPAGAGRVYGRVAGRRTGCPGSGDYECGYRGDSGGDRGPLSLGHGFGGTIRGGPAASGAVFGAGGGGRNVAADFSGDSSGIGSGDAVDVQAESGGAEGIDHGVGRPRVETNPSSISALVDERRSSDLPLNGRRFTDLLLLSPGVTQDPRGLTGDRTAIFLMAGFGDTTTAFWWMAGTTTTDFYAQAIGTVSRALPVFRRGDGGVSRAVERLWSGVGTGWRRGGECGDQVGHEHWHGSTFYYLRDSSNWGSGAAICGLQSPQ
jgi:hypothetical protein